MPTAWGCEYKDWLYTKTETIEGEEKIIDCRYEIDVGDDVPALPNDNRSWKTFQSCISETLGTFIFVLFFMISTDEKLKYSKDNVKNALVIASSYIASQLMAGGQYVTVRTGPCLNPATAFGLALFQADFNFPQYFIFPFLGCACSVIFYEFVFVKTQEYLEEDNQEEEESEEEEDEITDASEDKRKGNMSD